MVYYPQDGRSGPRPPMYSHRGGSNSSMRRQDEAYFYPNQMGRQETGYIYPNQMRRQDESNFYPNHMRRREEAYYHQRPMRRQDEAYFYPGQMSGREAVQYYPNEMRGGSEPPNRRPQTRFERIPDHLNTIMGHMGTITQGVHMMRQIGSLLSMFRKP